MNTQLKKILILSVTMLYCLLCTSFMMVRKHHLIVGNWGLTEEKKKQPLFVMDEKESALEILAFASDEITSSIILNANSKKEQEINFAFKIYEPFDEFKKPVLLMKNLCDTKTRIVFSILQLNKASLQLKFEKKYSSENIAIKDSILHFERTAGPPENMP